jgi:methyl-accepting chemotaxis protein
MDQATQHNAALVEETHASIEQTEAQAVELDRIVDVFAIRGGGHDGGDHAVASRPGGARDVRERVRQAG